MPRRSLPLLFGLIVVTAGPLSAEPAANKKVLTFADYDIWRTTTGVSLSRDGKYIAYLVGAEGRDAEAVVRHVPSGTEFRFPRGPLSAFAAAPKFTPDTKRVLLPLTATKAEADKAKADKQKPEPALAVIDLASGKEIDRIAGVGTFQVAGDGAGFIIYRKPQPPEPKADPKAKGATPPAAKATGSDLMIRDLTRTVNRTVADVSEFNLTHDEKTLVYVVASKQAEKNGVYVMNPRFGTAATPLKAGPGKYSGLTWDEQQNKLAFFYDDSAIPAENLAPPPRAVGVPAGTPLKLLSSPPPPPRWHVFVWERYAKAVAPLAGVPLGTAGSGFAALLAPVVAANPPPPVPPLAEVCGPGTPGLKTGWALSGSALSFSRDGTKLFVSTAPKRPAPPATLPADDIQLDIWHWQDAAIQPMQKLRAASDRNRTYGAVVLLDTRMFRHLSDETISVQQPGAGDWALGTDDRKYRHTTGYAYPVPSDYTLVNVRTGATKPVLTGSGTGVSLAPDGKFLLGFDGKDWFTLTVPGGKRANLTAKLAVKFSNEEHDMPGDAPSYGGGQWTPDGKFVLVSDRFDIWKLAADGSGAENLTKTGRTQGIRFTILRPRSADDRLPTRSIDLSKPLLLGAENLATRDSGFFRLEPGAAAPKLLLMGARSLRLRPRRRSDADVYLLTVQTFAQYPDYYVCGPDVPRTQARHRHQPEGEGVQLGHRRTRQVHQHRRHAAGEASW